MQVLVRYFASKDEKGSTHSLAALWSEKLCVSAFPVIVLWWISFWADEISCRTLNIIISLNDTGNVKMMENVLNFEAYLLLSQTCVTGVAVPLEDERRWLQDRPRKID